MRLASWLVAFFLLVGCEPGFDPFATPASSEGASSGETPLPVGLASLAAPSASPGITGGNAATAPLPAPAASSGEAPKLSAAPAASGSAAPARPHLYATWKRLPLTRERDHFDGELRLLEDSLVTRRGAERDAVAWLSETDPALPARLELLNARGEVIQSEEFDRPLAELREVQLHGDGRPTYQVTVDYSCGMGSYCGPITLFFEVDGPGMHRVLAVDDASNRFAPLSLMHSLKTSWRAVPARSGRGLDLIEVRCRPTPGLPQIIASKLRQEEPEVVFLTAYVRYSFEKAAWVKRWVQRKEYRDFIAGDIQDFIVENGRVRFL